MSRHRGAKPPRRWGLLGEISLLSPAYLLSVERWPFHAGPPDHYDRLSSLLGPSASQSGRLMPLHSTSDFRPLWAYHRAPPLPFGRRPPQSNCLPCRVLAPASRGAVRYQRTEGWYFKDGSTKASASASKPPTYPTHPFPSTTAKLQ